MSRKNSSLPSSATQTSTQIFAIWTAVCGARTLACRVHTRVNAFAPSGVCTRPKVVLSSRNQTSLYRIPFNIASDFAPLPVISNPVIIRLPLPKLPASAVEQPVSFTRRGALQRFQQHAGRNRRQQKHVDMIGHDYKRPEMVLAQVLTAKQRLDYQCGDRFAPQIQRTSVGSVQVAIHPGKSFAIGELAGWRKMGARQAAVQVPCYEEPVIIRIDVGKAALGRHALIVAQLLENSRVHTSVNAARRSACATVTAAGTAGTGARYD